MYVILYCTQRGQQTHWQSLNCILLKKLFNSHHTSVLTNDTTDKSANLNKIEQAGYDIVNVFAYTRISEPL
jgi:hypothetical protein